MREEHDYGPGTVRTMGRLCAAALMASVMVAEEPASGQQRPVFDIGVVLDGPIPEGERPVLLQTRDMGLGEIRTEILKLTERDFEVRFPEDKRIAGDWTPRGIGAAIDRLLEDPEVDLVLTHGALASNEACRRRKLPKPVIAPFALDMQAQQLPLQGNASGVGNLNYLITPGSIFRDLRTFQQLASFDTVHVLSDLRFLEAIPEIPEVVIAGGRQLGLELVTVPVDRSADEVLAAIPEDVEAVYITPPLLMPVSEFDRLITGLNQRRVPTFSLLGEVDVRRGVLAGIRRQTSIPRLARRIALNVQRILLGEDAGTLPVTLDQPGGLMINMATAAAIRVYPSFRLVQEAEQIRPEAMERIADLEMTLSEAVQLAVEANTSLTAVQQRVQAGEEDVRRARSVLLPQLGASLAGVQIDEDRAAGSFGSAAERTFTGGLAVSQLLLSDDAWAGYRISSRLQESLEIELEIELLDLALETSVAFLDTLRAQSLERIERENLRLTQSNLELARRRQSVGFSGPADVYRWESLLATDRIDLGAAHARVHSAFLVLNQLLRRPMEEMFDTLPPRLDDSGLVTGFGRLRAYVNNMGSFAVFKEFGVQEGLRYSPELRLYDRLIEAQERERLAASRSFWWPDVVLAGDLDRTFSRSGAGSELSSIPGLPGPADRTDWSLALVARLPLFSGGARGARLDQARQELTALSTERAAVAEQVELRIRAALFEMSSSYPAIELAREAAEAARRNLELVVDSYSRGGLSIIELLDAQNAARNAEEAAVNAEYDFLLDLMEFQRATNHFDFFRSSEGREAWFETLDAYFEAAGFPISGSER